MRNFFTSLIMMLGLMAANAQSVTVTQPNGGEVLYGCQNYLIKWNSSGVSNFWNIDYSLNGGSIWVSVASNLNITNGQYSWTVPMVASTNVLVRVLDYNAPSKRDSSNAPFTIQLPILVTSPNGGENWQGLSSKNITWTPAGTSGIFNISYSTNNGGSWASIATNIAANNYTWNPVANNPSTQALIRVQDATTACQQDQSDLVFELSPAQPILNNPNGGETWYTDQNRNITWNTSTFYTNLKLEYSIDSGNTYNLITASTPNNGAYSWTVPNTPSTKVFIKASNATGSTISDVNNAVFKIEKPTNFLTSPNGGENWRPLNTYNITWDNTKFISSVKLEYSLNNGTTWTTITNSASNTGTYAWLVPAPPTVMPTNQALIRITNVTVSAIMDTSNATFNIIDPVQLSTPNAAGTYVSCSTMGINWTAPDGFNNCSSLNTPTSYRNTYEIYTSINGGPYTQIWTEYHTQGVTGYGYTYTIPDIAPASIKVKVIARYNPACFPSTPIFWEDSSDFSSTVNAPTGSITVITPNGGVNLNANTNYNVTWSASGTSGFFDIQYSTNGGLSYSTIASNVSGTSYNWTIPNMVNNANVFVRVRDFTNNCRKDASNAANTINSAKPILNSPNGGEIWKVGNNQSITWNTSTILGNAILEFSTDNGLNWNNIATVSNTGNYSWTIPNLTTNQALVRISGSALTSFLDTSNAVFTITLPTPVLTSPIGGESWQYNSTYDITWDASSITSNVKLEFSIDSGTTWSVITNSTSNTGTYSWLIPATYRVLQNRALVRITNVTYPTAIDTSPNFFTIRPAVHVTSPNAASTYTSCNNLNINWTVGSGFNNYLSQNSPTSYRGRFEIYTSINGGSWSNIWTEYHNQGQTNYSYNYTIPDVAPATLKVMVIGYYNPTQYGTNVLYWADSSDVASNIINPSGTITVLSPNGGVNLNALTNYNITWSATGTSGFYDIGYSTNPTLGFSTIVSNVTGTSYNWNVVNTNLPNVYIKVRDNQNNCRKDASNAPNSIIPAQPILTSPNGGEVWKVNSNQNITWNTATFYSNVVIEFSPDGGANWNTVATVANTGSYSWTVPNAITSTCIIRVSNNGNPSLFDTSNANFTINLPAPIITSPNGGETFTSMNLTNITWDASSVASNVKIEYSLDSGNNWTLLVASTSNTGTYPWTLPMTQENRIALIRLTNVSFPSAIDYSDAVFNIRPPVYVSVLNNVTTLTACSTLNINWQRTNNANYNNYASSDATSSYRGKYELYYKLDNGAWTNFATEENYQTTTSYSYPLTIPDNPGSTIKVMVIAKYNTQTYGSPAPNFWVDSSNAFANIVSPTGTITVIAPNGGVNLNANTNYNITWTASGASGFYDIGWSTSATSGFNLIASNVSGNNYNWAVPNMNSASIFIKIRDYNNNCRKDVSNAANTVIPAQPILTSPNGGEVWTVNSSKSITWNTASFYTSVVIEFSPDGGNNWNTVATVGNTGTYSWTVPNALTNQAMIRVSNNGNPSLFDTCNANFTINLPTPNITSPNGGETFTSMNTYNITWDASSVASNVKIEYSLDSMLNWTTLVASASNTGTYPWTIPAIFENRKAFIRLTNVSFPSAMDTSDAKFNILPPVYVSVLNNISTVTACSNLNLNWQRTNSSNYNNYASSDAASSYRGKFELYYKLDNGAWINFMTEDNFQSTTSYSDPLIIPDNPGSTIKLMVIAKYNTQTYGSPAPVFWVDSSNAYANIVSPTGSITVLTPNGGVNINGNSNYNITWSASGSSGFYDIQYSPNGGASFATIATNVSGTSYNWAVPNMNNSNIVIRVRDNQNTCRKDNSDATNTITPVTPVLTSPNGGQVWNVGTNQNITWNASTIYSSVLIEFSTDNGSNWSTIATASNTGTYAWTIPNSLSTQCLIRISNTGNPSLNDVSNAVFTINLPKPIITYPNGGEIVQSNEIENITWNTTTVSSGVNLEYSSDSGATWNSIVNNYANSGSYPWTVPTSFENKTYLIRLINFSYPSSSDTSNAVFTVIPRIWVSTLNTTTTYTACNAVNIAWQRSNNTAFNNYNNTNTYPNFYEIYSSVNGGAWNYIATEYSYIGTYSYSTSYTLPDIAPATIKFLVIAKYNTSIYGVVAPYWADSSNAIANVVNPTGTITVTSPNGGVSLNALTTHNITWTASGTSGFFDVQYSTNGGVSFSTIVSNINGNSYTWSVPNLNSSNVIIRVRDNQNNCKKDVSNSANTIVPATPVLTSPNGGEVWNVNSSRNITWNAATLYSSVVIEFSIDNGTTWNFVTTATGNTGSYAWTIPFNPSTQCKIRISNFGNSSIFDVSDANFTIQIPSPVLLTPNGGETWYAGTSNAITWTPSTVFSATVNLEYSLDNGLNWTTIANNVNNTGTYNWTIPNVNSTSALVRISNSANTSFFDVSNALFTLRPYVRITTPNGGNLLGSCTQTSIGFERSPFYTNYNIEYSIDNGSNWISLQTNTAYGSTFNNYNWSIPNTSSTQALVRVYPTGVIANGDQSDAVFIIKRAVTIIQPNFGGVLVVGSTYPIKWSSDGISNFYDLAYSTTGPTGPWTNIVLNYNTSTNNYNWTVPNAPSTNCYIRVRDNLNTCKEDISDVAFSISTSANPITVTAPNGTDSLSACSNYNITWTEVGGPIGTYNISYSIDNGVNYIPIVSNYATTSYLYSWTVPNISSSTTLVRVQSAPNPTLFDISNALFTILPGKVKTNNDTTICLGASVQINTTGGSSYVWTPTTGLSSSTIANPVATPTATTMYIVSSTNGSCSLSDTLNITVVNGGSLSASVSVSPSPGTAICAGSVLTLTATPNNGGTNPSYQWKKNGINTGVNAPTLITSTAATGDVFSCIMTSNLLCVSNNPATSNNVTMTVFPAVTPSVTISTPFTTICSGANVTFTASPSNGGGAPSYQWKRNNVNIGTNSNTFSSSTLSNNDVISLEMTSNANCAAPLIVSSNALLMTVNPNSTPSISISASTTSICTGSNVNFTANASNAGASPTYQWKVNGTNVGTNSPTFSTTSLANNDNVTCDVTSSATCNTISTVSSNAIQISVSSSVTPSVSISPSTNNICAGTMVTFTATPTNGGSTPTYQWKVNNINAGTNSSTFASSSLNNGDSVKCVMTSNFGCASPSSGTSSSIGMLVNPTTPPTVSISSTSSTICAGTNVTFTANPTNGGASPSYQWKLNGNNVGGNAATYNSSALANNDSVWVIITSSSSCASPNNHTSNKLVTTVNPVSTPSISISAASNNICAGTSVLFTATPSNGGSSPIYQWKINGTNVGTNSTTYSSSTLANNDVITCALTSNIACATSTSAISSGILMTVTSNSIPTISISTASTTICSGTAVTFNSSITNGGGSPTFQWKLNGSNISLANASSYTTSGLANSDAISCVLTSNALCATPNTAASNSVNMTVNTSVTPSVSISASSMSICAGNSITFTAVPTNGGTTPVYQWKKNGTNVGTNSPTYITSTLSNLDNIVCDMTSNALCATTTNVSSNSLVIGVNTTVTPSVSITVSSNNICAGTSVTFTASPTNGGASPVYTWKKNGTVISGATNSTYNSTSLANNDIITCELTSNAPCASPAIAASNPIQMVVSPALTPSVSITATTTTICGGTNVKFTASPTNGGTTPIYQWKVNGSNVGINADTFSSTTLANGDAVTCNMTTSLTCVTTTIGASNTINMTVNSSNSPSLTISTPSISICSGTSATFTANPTNPGSSPSYQWKLNGSNVGTNSLTYINSSLNNSDTVSCVLTNTNLCAASNTAISNKIGMTVNSTNSPTVSISSNVGTTICSGASVTFTATPTNGGPSPSYQWKVNGTNVGTNSTSFATSSLNNGDVVTCIISIVNPCAASTNGTSNAIAMTVNSSASPTVSITATATTVCSGTSITFTATPTNPGSSPTYQWKVNGTNVGTNSNTFASSTLLNGDSVQCVFSNSNLCATSNMAFSNKLGLTINSSASPSISISAPSSNICAGSNLTFTAVPTNPGSSPTYQWKINGTNVGTNSTTYSSSTLSNGDVVTCNINVINACAATTNAASNAINMTVNNNASPSVSIAASSTNICAGANVTFTATPSNGGVSPTFQWKVNGSNVGTNSTTFASSSINHLDTITCVISNSNICATSNVGISNKVGMTVNSTSSPSISISAPTTSICAGSNLTFTAVPSNGGSSPTFQWKINGSNVGTNSTTFSSSSLSNGDVVTCNISILNACASSTNASSNAMAITVNSTASPTVSISASNANICVGANVTFTATPSNGGASPSYQWKVNGSNVGTNSTTFASNALNNLDTITCVISNTNICASSNSGVSNKIGMNVNSSSSPTISISAPTTNICAGSNVVFTAVPTNGGNSPSYQWKVNGSNVGTNSATFATSTLNHGDVVTCNISIINPCATSTNASSNAINMTVNSTSNPSVSISASNTTICAGANVTFTATPSNGGASPSYQWKVNGVNVGTNSNTFASSSLINNDTITCVISNTNPCATNNNGISNKIGMIVNPTANPSITISASSLNICAGANINFTATPTNGGINPSYQWKVNGSNVGTNSNTYSSSSLNHGDIVTCFITTTNICSALNTANSNSLNISVNPTASPSLSISASSLNICAGTNVTFTANPSNGGTTAAYQWKLNGANVGSNSLTYSNAGLQNGDTISCAISNSNVCAVNNNAISNTLTMVVNSNVTPSVSVNASATSACQGTNITFTASPTNGGSAPTYQWKVNGNNVGTNATIYSSTALNNNDSVWCTILSNATCAITSPISSNKTLLTITAPVNPSISISASATTICAGTNVIFTATPTNGGASPTYQWKINGINAGTNSATFASSSLANGDIITCALTSNATCINTPNANSNAVAMTVNTTVLPTISINTGTNTICAGTNTTFTASITNGGASPAFQWKINGVNVGTNSNSFSSSTLANGDIVTCVLTSNAVCPSSNNIASNAITMTVNPSVSPSVSISTPSLTVCAATNVTFTASPTNGGTTPIYQWKINGTNVGTNSSTFSSTTLANGNIITCLMTSNATCASPVSNLSNSITMTITSPVVPTISITANKTTICAGNAISFSSIITNGGSSPSYQWKVNGINAGTNAPTFNTSSLLNSDVVTCVLTSNATCITSATANSNAINITVNSSVAPSVNISASSTTICSGTMVNFTTFPSNGGTTPTYAWFNKGIQIGTGATFSSSSLGNNDTIYAIITSSNTCASPATGESNKVIMTVNTSVSPTISIAASNASICPSELVTFTATITNGGSNPIYQWQVNGFNAGSNSPTFVSSTLSNGDAVKCILTSNQICASPTALNSNTINISTNSLVVPTVSIAGSANNICPGQPVTFNATSTNGGINPTYQWKINGLPVGTNSSSFASTTLGNNDIVSCEMTSSLGCASPKKAVSANIIMIVNTSIPATIGISPNKKNICSGDLVTYTASITNGGTSPTYSWKVNGVNVGTNSATFATTNLNNNAIVTCTLFATSTCATAGILSNADTMIVRLKPALPVILALGDSLKSSVSGTSYTWFVNSTGAGSNKISIKPKTPGAYKVVVENNGCYSDSSVAFLYQPSSSIKSLTDIKIFAYPNPTADKVFIKLPSNNAYIAKVYDKNGRVVMEEQLINDQGSAELNTDRIASGIYTIEVSSKTEKGVIRLSVIK